MSIDEEKIIQLIEKSDNPIETAIYLFETILEIQQSS